MRRDFQANIFHDGAGRTGRGQIAADDLDDAGDSGERIANLVSQAGGQFAERRQVLGARHLGAMQALNLLTTLAQLLHHVVEVAAEVSDFVVALGEADCDVQVAFTHQCHLLLQFDHGPLDQIGKHEHGHGADDDRSRTSNDQHCMAIRIAQRHGRQSKEQQPCQAGQSQPARLL